MRKEYIIPATEVAQVATTSLMQSASPTTVDVHTDIEGEQW